MMMILPSFWMATEVALVVDQLRVEDSPLFTLVGSAAKVMVGRGVGASVRVVGAGAEIGFLLQPKLKTAAVESAAIRQVL
jgi:hypothetical protein